MCLSPSTPRPRRMPVTDPSDVRQAWHIPGAEMRPLKGLPHRAQAGSCRRCPAANALRPHARPHVMTSDVAGMNCLPQTGHVLAAEATGRLVRGSRRAYLRRLFSFGASRPWPSTSMAISGSADVNCALELVPSPSHTPSTYGGSGRSASGRQSGSAVATERLGRTSLPTPRGAAVCSVVTIGSCTAVGDALLGLAAL